MLIKLTSLVGTNKIQKKCSFRTRLVGLISTKTKEYFFLAAINFMQSVYCLSFTKATTATRATLCTVAITGKVNAVQLKTCRHIYISWLIHAKNDNVH